MHQYAYSPAIFCRVLDLHLYRRESFLILWAGLLRAANLAFVAVSVSLMMFIIFTVYVSTGGILTPKRVFTTLSLLTTIRFVTVDFLVQNIFAMMECRVATVRLQVQQQQAILLCINVCMCIYIFHQRLLELGEFDGVQDSIHASPGMCLALISSSTALKEQILESKLIELATSCGHGREVATSCSSCLPVHKCIPLTKHSIKLQSLRSCEISLQNCTNY
jgi:hypothetical protein